MSTSFRITASVIAVIALLATLGLGYWWGRSSDVVSATTVPEKTHSAERKALYWYDPMVPDQHFDKPGKSPFMDMQLVPKFAGEGVEGGIAIASGVRQNLGVRTVVVERGRLNTDLRVPGTIGWDLREERVVSARVDAVVERQYVKTPFETVRAGQPLASLIAPAWSAALAESRALASAQSASARALRSAAQAHLHALGIPAGSDRNGRITLTAPVDGVISEIGAREGQAVPVGTLLFRVNGTRTVWLEAAIPQTGTAGVAEGTPAEAIVDARPGEVFSGRVESLLPQIEAGSRTQRARIVLDNPHGVLAPGMFAQVVLRPMDDIERLLVPTDALIGTGARMHVIVQDGNAFTPVMVRAGRSGGGKTEILAGLKGGERVVASGQFLIDSEASLSGALTRLGASPAQEDNLDGMPDGGMSSDDTLVAPPESSRADANIAKPKPAAVVRQPKAPTSKQRECTVAYWYDPMVPDRHFDKPGKSPFMDMQLVPKFAAGSDADCTVRDVAATPAGEMSP